MAMKKLSSAVQSMFSSSTRINSYKGAIEELVYNSLDAGSTSIAIRLHIQENTIQIIDNGTGVTRSDMNHVGQRHMTSKTVDLSTLKAAPSNYGFRGQSLASIIEVSRVVKITSRHGNENETWVKTFYKSKAYDITATVARPSKGTTVDVQGFLFNHPIQKKTVNTLIETQKIKDFLERLSLVHNNISISLRDDSKHEIIFQIHKCRDIYQTLSSLFGIEKVKVQELQVEKKSYKVTAYIGKKVSEENGHHWIYLNGRFIQSSNLHQILDRNLTKLLCLKKRIKKKIKVGNVYPEDENINFKKNIPFYYVFVTCPYNEYNINDTTKQDALEFKDWNEITKLIEKLVKFYTGEVSIKDIKKLEKETQKENDRNENTDVRDQVKMIMEKYLGSNPKKQGVSQMQNGIKGKIVKRNKKRKRDVSLSKIIQNENKEKKRILRIPKCHDSIPAHENIKNIAVNDKQTTPNNVCHIEDNRTSDKPLKNTNPVGKKTSKCTKWNNRNNLNKKQKNTLRGKNERNYYKETVNQINNTVAKKEIIQMLDKGKTKRLIDPNEIVSKKDDLVDAFQHATSVVKKRCHMLAKKVDQLLQCKNMRRRKIFYNESSHHSTIKTDNQNITLKKKVGELIIHDVISIAPFHFETIQKDFRNQIQKKQYRSSHDLVQTILQSQPNDSENLNSLNEVYTNTQINHNEDKIDNIFDGDPNNSHNDPKPTYESHVYYNNETLNSKSYFKDNYRKHIHQRFITKQSRDNFITSNTRKNLLCKTKFKMNNRRCQKAKNYANKTKMPRNLQYLQESSYTIEFSKTAERSDNNKQVIQAIGEDLRNIVSSQVTNKHYTNKLYAQEMYDDVPNEIGDFTYTLKRISISSENGNEIYQSQIPKDNVKKSYFGTYTIDKVAYVANEKLSENENLETQADNVSISSDENNYEDTIYKVTDVENERLSENGNFETQADNFSSDQNNYEDSIDKVVGVDNERLSENDNLGTQADNIFTNENNYKDNLNVVFVSKSQNPSRSEAFTDKSIDPLNVCETILNSCDIVGAQLAPDLEDNTRESYNFSLDTLFGNEIVSSLPSDAMATINEVAETSRNSNNIGNLENINQGGTGIIDIYVKPNNNGYKPTPIAKAVSDRQNTDKAEYGILGKDDEAFNLDSDRKIAHEYNNKNKDNFEFNLKIRPRFVPKGLSPIFINCNTKNPCHLNLDEDYFDNNMYGDFIKAVETNTEIFEDNIENVNNLATKDIVKVNTKLKKDNAALNFEGDNLKQAQVLGQVDSKFIAAKMKGKCGKHERLTEYLVLFDQHAVHERIRLETNLADHLSNDQWKSVALDEVMIKLTHEDILYLHNYREKFEQLGLKWTVAENHNICITAIPEAILGKNARPVDVIIKAVKSLILEEVEVIKAQKGSLSLYPKSIMDLVFSEACRYAIKFGDRLSKSDCVELLKCLSECNTPFQCAHGRPVMAVIMDIEQKNPVFEVNIAKLGEFKRKVQLN